MNTQNVYVFLFNGFSDWEITYLTPEIQKSNHANLIYCSLKGSDLVSSGGLKIKPDISIEEIKAQDVSLLVLPGGGAWEEKTIKGIDNLVEALYAMHRPIAAICSATTYLGEKGYLDKVNHTSNALEYLKNFAPGYKGEKNYQPNLAVTDGSIITATGIAPIEFAREIFRKIELKDEEAIEKWYQLYKNGV